MISKIATSAERERNLVRALADLPAYFRTGSGSGNTAVNGNCAGCPVFIIPELSNLHVP